MRQTKLQVLVRARINYESLQVVLAAAAAAEGKRRHCRQLGGKVRNLCRYQIPVIYQVAVD